MRTPGSHSSEINAGTVRRLLMLVQILERHPEGIGVPALMQRIACSRRSIYRYLHLLEDNGFPVAQPERGRYCLTGISTSEYAVTFTEAEARILGKALEAMDADSVLKDSLIRKLRPIGGLSGWLPEPLHPELSVFLNVFDQAIAGCKKVLIIQYSSNRSGKTQDRIVEPFAILDHGTFIRAFDIAKGENRTFRISRMGGVRMLDEPWKYRKHHEKSPEPDMFGFTGSHWHSVQLEVSNRFIQLFREEYPNSGAQMFRHDQNTWRCEMQVKSWTGIGRFCLGLIEDLYQIHPEAFKEYLIGRLRAAHLFL